MGLVQSLVSGGRSETVPFQCSSDSSIENLYSCLPGQPTQTGGPEYYCFYLNQTPSGENWNYFCNNSTNSKDIYVCNVPVNTYGPAYCYPGSIPQTGDYPTYASLTPLNGIGGTTVTIKGSNFDKVTGVYTTNGLPLNNTQVSGDNNTITAVIPEGVTPGPLLLQNQYDFGGQVGSSYIILRTDVFNEGQTIQPPIPGGSGSLEWYWWIGIVAFLLILVIVIFIIIARRPSSESHRQQPVTLMILGIGLFLTGIFLYFVLRHYYYSTAIAWILIGLATIIFLTGLTWYFLAEK